MVLRRAGPVASFASPCRCKRRGRKVESGVGAGRTKNKKNKRKKKKKDTEDAAIGDK